MRSALRLLWALDVRHVAAHRTRLVLSVLGIAAGVALAVSVGALTTSIDASLRTVAQAAASDADIEVRPNGSGLTPDVLADIRAAPGVDGAGAAIESYVQVRNGDRTHRVLAVGIDAALAAMSPRAVEDVDVVDPFGLYLPRRLADDLGVDVGGEIEVTTPSGWTSVAVGAVSQGSDDRSRIVAGTVGVMQSLLGRGATYDVIYVDAARPDEALGAVSDAVGGRGRVGEVAFRGDALRDLLGGADAGLAVGSIVALFVGAFLVYNTMSMAAVERLGEAALLRAVGATRRQVFGLFVAEGAILGSLGGLAGVASGLGMARLTLGQRGSALEELIPVQITDVAIDPFLLVVAGASGVLASTLAAVLPARRVARADPVSSLGPTGALEDPSARPRRVSTAIAVVALIAGPAVAVPSVASGDSSGRGTMLGLAITLTGIALVIPVVVPWLARLSFGAMARWRRTPGVARLAVAEVLRSPGRTAFTVGAVLLALALVVGFAVGQAAFTRAFAEDFEEIVSVDLYVRSPTWRPYGSDVPLDTSIVDEIEAIDGVAAAWPFRLVPGTLDGATVSILAYDLDRFATYARLSPEGAAAARRQAELSADGIYVSPSLHSQLGYGVGDTIRLPTPTGLREVAIVGTFPDPAAVTPELFLDWDTYTDLYGTAGADTIATAVTDPDEALAVRDRIQAELGPRYGIRADTRDEYFDLLTSLVNSVVQLISSIQLVAVVVAALGLANTLLISTFERRRDLGVLRAIGMLRRQMRWMISAEAVLIGSLGVVLAWGLGTGIGLGISSLIQAQIGFPLPFTLPWEAYALSAGLGIGSALVASLYPAGRAARTDIVEAMRYE